MDYSLFVVISAVMMKWSIVGNHFAVADQFPTCLPKDFYYDFTECDENNGRWRVSVPKPNVCIGGSPNAPTRVACGISCDAGSYFNTTDLSCSTCPLGTYSLGGASRFNSWETIPGDFLIETKSFKSYIFTSSGSSKSKVNCTMYGWQPKGKAVASFGGPCVSTMSYSVKLVKPGYLIYKYQYSDKNIMFSFKVQNEQCHTIEEAEKYKWPTSTSKNKFRSVRVALKPGINILYWSTIGMEVPSTGQPVLISDIEVMGVEFTSKCALCESGSYSNKTGSILCYTCPKNTFSTKGATKCSSCDSKSEYSIPGSSKCSKRTACTDNDYYEYNLPCNDKKQTRIMYKWIEPKICDEKALSAVSLPELSDWKDCPPCNPGMTYSHNISGCVFCPKNAYSDGSSPCETCPASTAPNYGYQYKWWHSLPSNMEGECIRYDFDKCESADGWKPKGDYIETSRDEPPSSYLLLSLDIPGFRDQQASKGALNQRGIGHVDFVFETQCSTNCEFAFLMTNSKDNVVVEKWDGSKSKQHFRYMVIQNDSYTFTWSFRKVVDEENFGFMYDDSQSKQYANDYARIFVVNVTGTSDGGASSCLTCPKGTKGDGCIPCPGGHYISKDKSCVACPKDTIIDGREMPMGVESCKKCPNGLRSKDGQSCYSDCIVNVNGQHFDFTSLSNNVQVRGKPLFSSSGTHYYRLFNVSLCGQDKFSTCTDNVTYGHKGMEMVSAIQSHICRSTLIPVHEGGVPGFMTTMSVSLGDVLIGITTNTTFQNISIAKDFVKGDHNKDIHFFYKSPEATHACKQGRATTITARCDRVQKGNGHISAPPSCGDGTCDGCSFHFLWETRLACPLCTDADYQTVKGECLNGQQLIHYIPSSHCLLPGGQDEAPLRRTKCQIIPKELQIIIGLAIGCAILLVVLVVYFWKKNRKLEYNYMKLVQSNCDKDGELPVAESCGIEDDEYMEDEGYDNIEYNKGKGLLGKIRAMTTNSKTSNQLVGDDQWGTEGKWMPE